MHPLFSKSGDFPSIVLEKIKGRNDDEILLTEYERDLVKGGNYPYRVSFLKLTTKLTHYMNRQCRLPWLKLLHERNGYA